MARRHIVSVDIWLFSFLTMTLDGGPPHTLALLCMGKEHLVPTD